MEILPQNIDYFKDFPGLVKRTITYTNPNPLKPMGNNISDLFLTFTGNGVTEIGGSVAQEGDIQFIVNEINSLDTKEIIVHGVVTNDAEVIEMIWNGDMQIRTIDFVPGGQDFSFVISPENKNVQP
jgi:hypothetical protein